MAVSKEKRVVTRRCIYCGGSVSGVKKGEHVVPKALGGAVTIKKVCQRCNNEELSKLDEELTERSPLRLLARKELKKPGESVWGYDAKHDVAIEARISENGFSSILWPQLVFKDGIIMFFGDHEELMESGWENSCHKFLKYARVARGTLRKCRRPRWIWNQVKLPPRRGKFPPRVYTKHTLERLSNRAHFICRYTKKSDRVYLLKQLDNWDPNKGVKKKEESLGVRDPESQFSYADRIVLRALVKMGINLLGWLAKDTTVSKDTFEKAIAFVRYDLGLAPPNNLCGFVVNEDIQYLCCPAGAHKFLLEYDHSFWTLDCAFFGGHAGATVTFPGPSRETWRRAEITTPLRSNEWVVKLFSRP